MKEAQYEIRRTIDVPPARWHEPVGDLLFTVPTQLVDDEKAFEVARSRAESSCRLGYPCRVVFVDRDPGNYRSWCAWSQTVTLCGECGAENGHDEDCIEARIASYEKALGQ